MPAADDGHFGLSDKLAFHDADTDTDFLADILARIVARMSVSVSVSASWNSSYIPTIAAAHDFLLNYTVMLSIYCNVSISLCLQNTDDVN